MVLNCGLIMEEELSLGMLFIPFSFSRYLSNAYSVLGASDPEILQ